MKFRKGINNGITDVADVKVGHVTLYEENGLFRAVVETTEEAVINSLQHAETTKGRKGRVVEKAPLN